jgi:hypothetical protein
MKYFFLFLSFCFLTSPLFAQDQNPKIKSYFTRIEKKNANEANFIIEWELTTASKSQEVTASLYQSANLSTGVGPAFISAELLKPTSLNDEKTKFKVILPFGDNKTLNPNVYSILRYGINVAFDSGVITLRDEIILPATIPVDFSLLSVTLFDTKMILKIRVSRPCETRIWAFPGTSVPSSTGAKPNYEEYLRGDQEITISPLAHTTQYSILCQAIDKNRNPETLIGSRVFTDFNGQQLITKSSVSRAQIQVEESPIATPKGIKVKVKVKSTSTITFKIFKRIKGSIEPIFLIGGNVDGNFEKDSSDFTTGNLLIPFSGAIKLPDEEYFISLRADQAPAFGLDYGQETDKRSILAYPQKLAEAFVLTFTGKGLSISAQSIDRLTTIKLAAEWLTPNGPSPLATRVFTPVSSTNPDFPIPYPTVSSTPPVIFLTIKDDLHDVIEEARVQLRVDSKHFKADGSEDSGRSSENKKFTDQINSDKDGATDNPNKGFKWKDLAKSGIGAVLRFLVGIF